MINKEKEESKVQIKKKKKENELFSAAYELFTTKGTKDTAIDDIVKRAGVAKGTFYLYFKDKYDIINKLILLKSSIVVKEAMLEVEEQGLKEFEDKIVYFINYIINYFKENKLMLKLINKNLSWGVFKRALMRNEEYRDMEEVVIFFMNNMVNNNVTEEEAMINLFLIFELVGSVCYSSIIHNEPTDIDSIKPILFKKVLALLRE